MCYGDKRWAKVTRVAMSNGERWPGGRAEPRRGLWVGRLEVEECRS